MKAKEWLKEANVFEDDKVEVSFTGTVTHIVGDTVYIDDHIELTVPKMKDLVIKRVVDPQPHWRPGDYVRVQSGNEYLYLRFSSAIDTPKQWEDSNHDVVSKYTFDEWWAKGFVSILVKMS
jgi:hypothetical protein